MPSRSCSASRRALALRSRYRDITAFTEAHSPARQLSLCHNPEACFFGDFPTLSELRQAFNVSAAFWIVPQLVDLSQFCGAAGKLQDNSLEQCAELIAQNYSYLRISEVMLFFYRFKLGRYGRFYGAVDPILIMQALQDFVRYDRSRAIDDRLSALQRQRAEAAARQACTYEQYLAWRDKQNRNNNNKHLKGYVQD